MFDHIRYPISSSTRLLGSTKWQEDMHVIAILAVEPATVLDVVMVPANAKLGRLVPQLAKHPPCVSRSTLQMQAGCLWEASLGQGFLS